MRRLCFAATTWLALTTTLTVGAQPTKEAGAQPTKEAGAQPTKEACVDAYRSSQELRRDGAFRAAITQLLICARDPCPGVLQTDCIEWLREARSRAPSIIVKARSRTSTDISDVRVLMDGVELTTRLDGRALDVDAGEHTFVFHATGAPPVERKLLITEGEKGRVVDIELAIAGPAAQSRAVQEPRSTQTDARTVPVATYGFGALGLGALGVGAVFGTLGVVARGDLSSCKGHCAADDVDAAHRKLVAADVSFAIGALSLGAAGMFYLTRPSVQVTAAPTTGGLMLGASRSF